MADSSTEIRKRKKYNGEEDPIVIAQRFLNIFRQLHIFSDERKTAFDKMLLELSPEVRGAFASLPGGGLVQDYIDDLEEKNGIAHTAQVKAPVGVIDDDEEVSKAKILATALAEAQVQATAKMQQMNISQPAPQMPAAGAVTAANLKLDKDFSRELAEALASALAATHSEEKTSAPAAATTPQPVQPTLVAPAVSPTTAVNAEVKIPEDFGRNLAEALSEVLEKNSSQQQEEIKTLSKELLSGFNQAQQGVIAELQAANQENKSANNSLAKAFFETQSRLVQSFNLQMQKIVTQPAQPAAPQPVEPQVVPSSSGSAAIQIDNSELIEAVTSTQKQIAQMLENVSQKQSSETLQLAKILKESQMNVIEVVKSANENKKDDSTAIAAILKESKQQLNEVILATTQASKNENLEIAKILKESQLEVAKMLIQSNQINASNNQNANTIQIHNAPAMMSGGEGIPAADMEKIVSGIVKAQSELFREVSTQQTQNLSAIISTALKESQEISAQTIAKALEGLKNISISYPAAMPQSYYAAPVPQPPHAAETYVEPTTSPEPVMEEYATVDDSVLFADKPAAAVIEETAEESFAEPLLPVEEDTSFNGNEFSGVEEMATAAEETQPKKKKKKKKKKKNSAAQENENIETSVFTENSNEFAHEDGYLGEEQYQIDNFINQAEQNVFPEEIFEPDLAAPAENFAPYVDETEINTAAEGQEPLWTANEPEYNQAQAITDSIDELTYEELDGHAKEPEDYKPGELWGSLQEEVSQNEPVITATPSLAWEEENTSVAEGAPTVAEIRTEPDVAQETAPVSTTEGEDWEWEYEEVLVPESEISASNAVMLDAADEWDPYGAPQSGEVNQPSAVSQIFTGNLYFYENKVYDATDKPQYLHNESSAIVIKELDEKGSFDPYLLNSDT